MYRSVQSMVNGSPLMANSTKIFKNEEEGKNISFSATSVAVVCLSLVGSILSLRHTSQITVRDNILYAHIVHFFTVTLHTYQHSSELAGVRSCGKTTYYTHRTITLKGSTFEM
jgi:hypothetical protein